MNDLPTNLFETKNNDIFDNIINSTLPEILLPNQDDNLLKLHRHDTFRIILFCFPMTGHPDHPLPKNWNIIPGANGCTAQHCSFRDNYDNWGSDFTTVDNLTQPSYKTILKDVKTIEANLGQPINAWNKKNMAIGEEMWDRINKAIKADKKSAVAIAGYLQLVGNDVNHPHKMMAEFLGYSNKPLKGLRYEHAMPATQAYIYLLDSALSSGKVFKNEFKNIIANYKLIALDIKDDDKINKVVYDNKKAYLKERMPPGWIVETGKWYDRYFNNLVASIDGGINPISVKMLDGTTMADVNNLTNEGRPL